jgi:hypothetical protein
MGSDVGVVDKGRSSMSSIISMGGKDVGCAIGSMIEGGGEDGGGITSSTITSSTIGDC